MSLFSVFKSKKSTDAEIIASVEEEDITKQLCPAPVAKEEPVQDTTENSVEAENPVENVENEPKEELSTNAEETFDDKEDLEYTVCDISESEEPLEETQEVAEEPVEEVEEVEEKPVEETEEVTEEPVEEVEEVTEEPIEEVEEVAEETQEIPEEIADIPEEVIKEPVYQPTFSEKMDIADDNIQRWYDEIKNYALRFKKLTSRISKKYDSINQGRFQFVKISLAGKTLKLNLNMDITQCDPKYHCVDKKSTKTYEDVPVQMRIKSDRGLRYGKELIDQCAEIHGLIENPKFKTVNSLEIIRKYLEIGNTEDIIIETDTEE